MLVLKVDNSAPATCQNKSKVQIIEDLPLQTVFLVILINLNMPLNSVRWELLYGQTKIYLFIDQMSESCEINQQLYKKTQNRA